MMDFWRFTALAFGCIAIGFVFGVGRGRDLEREAACKRECRAEYAWVEKREDSYRCVCAQEVRP